MLITLLFTYFVLTSGNQQKNPENEVPLESTEPFWKKTIENSTSCEEFLNNTKFDPMSVVDVDWKIFYLWNMELGKSYHIKFHLPTQMLVKRFSVALSDDIKPPVNWTQADLFMETSVDFSALFIKTNVSGLYRIIPSLAFEYNGMPNMQFALKVVEPGYLGIMNCKYRVCYGLAPNEMMPGHSEVELAAKKIGFRSTVGRSYFDQPPEPPVSEKSQFVDDSDDDLQVEIEMDEDRLELF